MVVMSFDKITRSEVLKNWLLMESKINCVFLKTNEQYPTNKQSDQDVLMHFITFPPDISNRRLTRFDTKVFPQNFFCKASLDQYTQASFFFSYKNRQISHQVTRDLLPSISMQFLKDQHFPAHIHDLQDNMINCSQMTPFTSTPLNNRRATLGSASKNRQLC